MTDMNILDLFLKASLLVKLIMLILIGFSIASWAIIIQRTRILNAAAREAERSGRDRNLVSYVRGAWADQQDSGTGETGKALTAFEMLGMVDLSTMVKAGVQWGLFGGAIENLGTATHHKQYVVPLINLDVLGCFGMTETGHGSNVQALQTVATYDSQTGDFVLNSEGSLARKDYIGGAAEHATVAAVFAQLVTGGPGEEASGRGVHCFVVPIRDEAGNDLPGITTSDCGYKGGLAGVDNGRIVFDNVRVPRANLLNKYADVGADGAALVRGIVTAGGGATVETAVFAPRELPGGGCAPPSGRGSRPRPGRSGSASRG